MMRHPERWVGLVLPLKHRTEKDGPMGLLGFMFEDPATHEAMPVVFVGCMYFQIMGQELKDMPIRKFENLEAVVAAGWEVN